MIHRGTTPILFTPARVKAALAHIPTVAALIPDPEDEGLDSRAFPGVLRKTERELYRWIANQHYHHLIEPTMELEEVLAAGCDFGRMLTTRSRELFVSLSAEVFVAHDLLRRGYDVETIGRTDDRSPDLLLRGRGIDMAVEVYSPRELLAVDEWIRTVLDLAQYADARASFDTYVTTTLERSFGPSEQLDPWAHDRILEATGATVMAEITGDVEDALRELRPHERTYRHSDTPMTTTVRLDNVREPPDGGPLRQGSFSYPGFSGYSPAGVFRTVVDRTVKKAWGGQTLAADAETRALVVYLMGTQIAKDLTHPAYLTQAEAVLNEVEPTEYGLDVIAFVVRALPHGLAYVLAIADDAHLTREQIEALFGQTQ